MARDDFSRSVIDRLAKRVGMKCSFPDCRRPTSGPDSASGVTNVGVAAHISAASPGGPRFDDSLDADQRSALANGIWLCQTHAKLIDDDEIAFPASTLREWREVAEHMAALEARGYAVRKASLFSDAERKVPGLVAEMRADLNQQPLVRQFILLSRSMSYNPGVIPYFTYFYNDHEYLSSMITVLEHAGAVYDVAFNRVPRYNFAEDFVSYLLGE